MEKKTFENIDEMTPCDARTAAHGDKWTAYHASRDVYTAKLTADRDSAAAREAYAVVSKASAAAYTRASVIAEMQLYRSGAVRTELELETANAYRLAYASHTSVNDASIAVAKADTIASAAKADFEAAIFAYTSAAAKASYYNVVYKISRGKSVPPTRTKVKWWILKIDGNQVLTEKDVLPRASDALPSNGDPFTPWYQTESHLHYEDGKLIGIHFFGTMDEALLELSYAKKGMPRLLLVADVEEVRRIAAVATITTKQDKMRE